MSLYIVLEEDLTLINKTCISRPYERDWIWPLQETLTYPVISNLFSNFIHKKSSWQLTFPWMELEVYEIEQLHWNTYNSPEHKYEVIPKTKMEFSISIIMIIWSISLSFENDIDEMMVVRYVTWWQADIDPTITQNLFPKKRIPSIRILSDLCLWIQFAGIREVEKRRRK